jgi:1,4-dihydroxy-2-naphthoyl-CoA hydrolase
MTDVASTPTALESIRSGWTDAMGMTFGRVTPTEVTMEWTVGPQHLQPFGLVHGGVYCGAVETACSMGALAAAGPAAEVVGIENHTSFLRPVRSGVLRLCATPVQVGQRAQLWEARITDEQGKLVATGRLRLFCSPRKAP